MRPLLLWVLISNVLIASRSNDVCAQTVSPHPATRPPNSSQLKERYRSFAKMHDGDPIRGKALFFDEQRLACSRCHVVNGRGGNVGPDLSAAGDKFGRLDLIESILSPSATIAVGYSTTVVKTKAGQTVEGIIKEANNAEISLAGADGKITRLKSDEIQEQRTVDRSLMPEELYAGISMPEFADLIAYLATLKLPETSIATHHGMPLEIPELKRNVKLIPFINAEHRFEHPVWFGPVPGVLGTFAVIEHESGKIWLLDKSSSVEFKTVFLETGKYMTGTRGLLGLVFHPQYATNRRYFVIKHLIEDGKFASILLEGLAAPDLKRDSGQPLKRILKFDAVTNVHYGGSLAFGPDRYLYVGMGDTGPQGDPEGHAQNLSLLLGKILRIDVDHHDPGKTYAIPPDNPFAAKTGIRPEIWAYGLREPWRFSFDPLSNDLWVGDVGQDLYEEIDIVRRGENYGWNVYEGFEPYSNRYRREGENFIPPVFAWTRKYGASSTGGFVYRADPKSSFYGVYIFGDYQVSRLFALTQENRVLKEVRSLGKAPEHVVSFGRDGKGELYVVGYEGMIYKMDFSEARFE